MATPRISVVVPIYKVEECLAWCLDSLLAQDMPDWEGVLVTMVRRMVARHQPLPIAKRIHALSLSISPTVVYRARAMRASLRPRRLSLRFWIPTTGLRLMRAA